jgi:hypothetical protein
LTPSISPPSGFPGASASPGPSVSPLFDTVLDAPPSASAAATTEEGQLAARSAFDEHDNPLMKLLSSNDSNALADILSFTLDSDHDRASSSEGASSEDEDGGFHVDDFDPPTEDRSQQAAELAAKHHQVTRAGLDFNLFR